MRMILRHLVAVLATISLVACGGAPAEDDGPSDFDRGRVDGWSGALATVRHCAATVSDGEFPECLANESATRLAFATDDSSEEIAGEMFDVGKSIELAFFAYNRR